MKQYLSLKVVVGFLILLFTLNVQATNVAVIDVDKILKNYPVVQKIDKTLQSQFGPRANKLVTERKSLEEKESELKRNASIMTDTDKNRLETDIANENNVLQSEQSQFNQDLQQAQDKAMKSVLSAINQAVKQIASAKNYDIVLQKDRTVYIKDSVDISNSVLSILTASKNS